jgi:hypothetical protein
MFPVWPGNRPVLVEQTRNEPFRSHFASGQTTISIPGKRVCAAAHG